MSAPAPIRFLPRTLREARSLALQWEGLRRDFDDWIPAAVVTEDLGIPAIELRSRALRAQIGTHRVRGVLCIDFGDARTLLCERVHCSWFDLMSAVTGL